MTKSNEYTKILQIWREKEIKSGGDLDELLYSFKVLFAYNSGKIENEKIDYHDTREIFEKGKVISYTGDIKCLFEQQNQKDCYEFLRDKIADRQELSVALVKKIHFELTKGTYDEKKFLKGEVPGEFKKSDYIVGKNQVGLPPESVEEELSFVLNQANGLLPGEDLLTAGSYLHAAFEYIHPFADGNGRVGRTLLNYYLMVNRHPPLVVFEEDKKEYYAALEEYDTKESLQGLKNFFESQLIKTWKRQLLNDKKS